VRLSALTIFELRGGGGSFIACRRRCQLPRPLGRRGTQGSGRAYGGLSTATTELGGRRRFAKPRLGYRLAISLRPGTRLVREWRRVTIWSSSVPTASGGAVSTTTPLCGRAKDHGRSLVRPAFLASGGGRWTLLQLRDQTMARADPREPAHHPLRDLRESSDGASSRNSILSTLSGRHEAYA
jgi:hypothetical protein